MRCRVLAVLAVLALPPLHLAAQHALPASVTRVRVTLTPEAAARLGRQRWTDTMRASSRDSLMVAGMAVGWADVQRLERFEGRRSSVGKGAWMGAVLGGGTGLVAGATQIDCGGDGWTPSLCGGSVAAVTLGSAAVGAVIGMIVGAAIRHDTWTPVHEARVEVEPTVQAGRPGVAISWRF